MGGCSTSSASKGKYSDTNNQKSMKGRRKILNILNIVTPIIKYSLRKGGRRGGEDEGGAKGNEESGGGVGGEEDQEQVIRNNLHGGDVDGNDGDDNDGDNDGNDGNGNDGDNDGNDGDGNDGDDDDGEEDQEQAIGIHNLHGDDDDDDDVKEDGEQVIILIKIDD